MKPITRRHFVQFGLGVGGVLATMHIPSAHARKAGKLRGGRLAKYIQPLPVPGAGIVVATPSALNTYSFTQNGFGPGETQSVFYTNQTPQMPASLLWFHDHSVGATRLNVFAGLAAAYILRDAHDTGTEPNPIGIPGGAYEIPLVVQDRQFNADGTFLYPTSDIPGVTWIGEYFGDVMLVNGKVWPFLTVEPRIYRFRILNGSNARILSLDIGGTALWQIGAEGGLFDVPVPVG